MARSFWFRLGTGLSAFSFFIGLSAPALAEPELIDIPITAPSYFSVMPGPDNRSLSGNWETGYGHDGYRFECRDESSFALLSQEVPAGTGGVTLGGALPGRSYFCLLHTLTNLGSVAPLSVRVSLSEIEAPYYFNAMPMGSSGVDLNWATSAYADGYWVGVLTQEDAPCDSRALSAWRTIYTGFNNSHSDASDIAPAQSRSYCVCPFVADSEYFGYCARTGVVLPPLSAPTNLSASAMGTAESIELSWTRPEPSDEQVVYRKIGAEWKEIGTTSGTWYSISGVEPGSCADFRVTATLTLAGQTFESPPSNEAHACVALPPPPPEDTEPEQCAGFLQIELAPAAEGLMVSMWGSSFYEGIQLGGGYLSGGVNGSAEVRSLSHDIDPSRKLGHLKMTPVPVLVKLTQKELDAFQTRGRDVRGIWVSEIVGDIPEPHLGTAITYAINIVRQAQVAATDIVKQYFPEAVRHAAGGHRPFKVDEIHGRPAKWTIYADIKISSNPPNHFPPSEAGIPMLKSVTAWPDVGVRDVKWAWHAGGLNFIETEDELVEEIQEFPRSLIDYSIVIDQSCNEEAALNRWRATRTPEPPAPKPAGNPRSSLPESPATHVSGMAAPSYLSAMTMGISRVEMNWGESEYADSYWVGVRTDGQGSCDGNSREGWATVYWGSGTSLGEESGVAPGQSRSYCVCPFLSDEWIYGDCARTEVAVPSLSPPTGLSASAMEFSPTVDLYWSRADFAEEHVVYRREGAQWRAMASTTDNWYSFSGIEPGSCADLRVTTRVARDGQTFESAPSNEVQACIALPPAPPEEVVMIPEPEAPCAGFLQIELSHKADNLVFNATAASFYEGITQAGDYISGQVNGQSNFRVLSYEIDPARKKGHLLMTPPPELVRLTQAEIDAFATAPREDHGIMVDAVTENIPESVVMKASIFAVNTVRQAHDHVVKIVGEYFPEAVREAAGGETPYLVKEILKNPLRTLIYGVIDISREPANHPDANQRGIPVLDQVTAWPDVGVREVTWEWNAGGTVLARSEDDLMEDIHEFPNELFYYSILRDPSCSEEAALGRWRTMRSPEP